jgi:hypothetical protein
MQYNAAKREQYEHESDEDYEEALMKLYKRLEVMYDRDVNINDLNPEANTLETLMLRVATRQEENLKYRDKDPETWWHNNRRDQMKDIDELMTIVHPEGDTGAAVQAMAQWSVDYLKKNLNFNLARTKQSSNLSRFGDFMHGKLSSTEAINEVLFTHEAIILLQASAHHVVFLLLCN